MKTRAALHVASVRWKSNYGSGDEDGPEFIGCVDGQQPQIHEVWTFCEDSVTREVHPKVRVDVVAGFVGDFNTNYLTPSWFRVPMFGKISFMEISSGLRFLTSGGPMDRLGLPIYLLLILVGETKGIVSIQTGVVNLGGIPKVFMYRGIFPPVSFQFTTG